jgi:hypothetical protein
MLFNYRYVNHSIERLQVYLDHLVKEVWCKANGPFSLNLSPSGIAGDCGSDSQRRVHHQGSP